MEAAFTLVGALCAAIPAGMLGRWLGRRYQQWDKPYEWRVKYGPKGGWSMMPTTVPNIPKDRWW